MDLRQTYLALKIKLIKRCGFDAYKTTEKKNENKGDTVFTGTGDDDIDFIKKVRGSASYYSCQQYATFHFFSNAELYINNHQIHNSNGPYAHKTHISNKLKNTLTDYQGDLHCEGYDYEEDPENLLEVPFFTRRMKLYSGPDSFMLYGKLVIDFRTASELLYPNTKVRIRQVRTRPNFYMISENPNVSLGFVDCSLYTRLLMLKEDYHKKRMSQLAYTPVEYKYMETLAKTYIIPARQNQFFKKI